MAQSIEQIQNTIIANLAANGIAVSTSQFSRRRIMTYVVAVAIFALWTLYDIFTIDTEDRLKKKNPPTKAWYAQKCLDYQHGFPLVPEKDFYDNTGYTDSQIAASKVIKYAAIVRQTNPFGRILLRIKIAGSNGTDLNQVSQPVIDGLTEYFEGSNQVRGIAAAGEYIRVESRPYDKLQMKWTIYYDPLILNNQGGRLDGTNSDAVRTAIKSYLRDQQQAGGMPFSGTYVKTFHQDWVQKVPGVIIPKIVYAKAAYGLFAFTDIDEKYEPDAGWLRFDQDTDLITEYLPQSAIQ